MDPISILACSERKEPRQSYVFWSIKYAGSTGSRTWKAANIVSVTDDFSTCKQQDKIFLILFICSKKLCKIIKVYRITNPAKVTLVHHMNDLYVTFSYYGIIHKIKVWCAIHATFWNDLDYEWQQHFLWVIYSCVFTRWASPTFWCLRLFLLSIKCHLPITYFLFLLSLSDQFFHRCPRVKLWFW